jgi:hypothetical protein
MFKFTLTIVAGLVLGSGVALAQTDAAGEAGSKDSLQLIVEQQEILKADLDDGGLTGLTPRQNKLVRKAQDEMFAITAGKTTLDELTIDEKVRLENALERINAEVVNTRGSKDDQSVCWRERMSGTNMKVTRCGTAAEMREAREGARDFLERPKTCGKDCGGQ